MSNLETVLADAGYEQINADLIEQLKKKQEAGTLTAAEANLLAEIEALGLDLSTLDGQALTAEDLQALGDAQVSLPSPASAPFASGGLGGLAGLGALGGGGGGGASGGTAVASIGGSLQGQLINGYIQGARVFQDANGDGILNNGEIYADTDSEGGFTLSGYIAGGGDIIASTTSATTDVTTGATVTTDFKLALSASTDTSNGVVISPLSTLLADGGISESDLKSKLGIDAGIDIITYDPIATALSGSASEVANALKFKSVSTQVSNLLDVGASALSANSDHSKDSATEGVVASLIDKLNAGTNSNIDLTGTTFLTETLDLAASKLSITDTTDLDAVKGNTISNLGSLNQKIEDAEANTADPTAALSSMYTAARVAQVDLETAIETASSEGGSDADLTGFDVDSQIASADIPAVNLVSNSKFDSATGWSGNAANAVDGANYANPTAAGNPWDVNLSYVLSLTQGESYTLSFRAKGAEGRALKAGLGLNVAPYTNDVSDITLTADWETYTVNVESIAFGGDDSRVIFDMGHDVGEVFIDDVVLNLVESETSESSEEPSDSSAVFDGLAFSADSTVEAFEGSSAEAIADTTDGAEAGNYVIQYTKTPTSKNYAGVTVGDLTGNLVDSIPFDIDGGTTAISARIYTAEAGKVVRMQVADSSGSNDANYVHAAVTLDSVGWNTVTFDFASPVARWVNANGAESTVALNANVTYDEISIFPDWENGLDYNGNAVGTALTADAVYYIDDVQMASSTDDTLEGQLINGYIQGAMVFQDINGDGEHNEGEAFDYTDSEGAFTLEGYVAGGGEVIASTNANTTDVTTGAKVTTEFKLNLDADTDVSEGVVISPLSTLLVSGELDEAGLKAKLGIDESIDIFSYDPIAAAEAAGNLGDTAAAEIALQFKSASTQVSNFLDVGASTIGKSTGLEKDQAMFGVIDSLIQKFATDDPIDFADTSFLSSAIDIAAQSLVTEMPDFEFDFTSLDQVKSTTVTKLGDLNQKIEDAIANTSDVGAALSEMYKSAKVAQDDLEAKIEEIFAAETIDATLLQSFGSFDLDAALGEVDLDAEIPEFNLIGNATFDGDWGWTDATVVDGAYFRNVAEPGQAHEANLSYALPLMQGETYTLTFRAKGTEGRSLIAGVGLNQAPWTADTEEVTLTADWETHSITVSSADFDSFNGRVLFDMGHEAGDVYIDDVVLNFAETSSSSSNGSPADLTGYTLAFEDNFDDIGAGPNGQNWVFDEGNDGWGNNEVQDYQSDLDDAMIVDGGAGNGALQITARGVNGNITSARVRSDIDNLDPYGYFEVRAKLPSEAGAWPAIWLLGDGGRQTWPNEGEIDLVEWSSAYHDEATGTDMISALHYPDNHGGNANDMTHSLDTPVDEWHVYQTWWTPTEIAIGVDGTREDAHLVYTKPDGADNDAWPFDGPMDLIMNIAIGGTLGGSAPTGDFSYNMLVDYVRIYQTGGSTEESSSVFDGLTFSAESTVEAFEGASAATFADNTDGAAEGNYVIRYVKTPTSKSYAGVTVGDLANNLVDAIPFDIAGGQTSITARIHTAEAGKVVRMQVADSAGSNDANYVHAAVTLENVGWNTVTFDFSSPVARWVAANGAESAVGLSANVVYDEISIFPDWENGLAWDDSVTGTALTEDAVYLIDDIQMPSSANGNSEEVDNTPAEFDGLTFSAESTVEAFEGASAATFADNTDGAAEGNYVIRYVKTPTSKSYAGVTVGDLANNLVDAIPFDIAGGQTSITARIHTAEAGKVVRMQVADSAGSNDANYVHAAVTLENVGWNAVTFDFSSPVARWVAANGAESAVGLSANVVYDEISIFPDWENGLAWDDSVTGTALTEDAVYLIDDIQMPSSANGNSEESSTEPTAAPSAPTADSANVTSLFSDSYTDIASTTWSTSWDQTGDPEDVDLGGNTVKKYTNVGYIGIEPGSTIDASGMDTLNLTVWRTDATADLKIKLVDYGSDDAWGNDNVEHEINLAAGTADAVAAGEWVSLEIDMSDFTGLTTSGNIGQIILSSHTYDGNGDPVNSGETLYIDNFFFSSTPAPTEPTAAPSAPTADSANVTSLFSDSYTDIASTTWSTSWDQTGDPEDVDLGGNTVKKYTNVGYIGIEPGSTIDASGMDTLNLTVWRTDATADLKIKLVDYGSDDAWGNDNVEHEINLAAGTADAVAAGEWVSLEIDMSDFTGLTTSGNIGQIILSSHTYDGNGDPVNSGETLYIDNFFFSSTPAPTEPTAAPSAPTADSANVTSLFSDSYTDIASTTWSTSWDQTGDPEDVDLGGNTVKKYTNVGYIGIEPGSTIDASGMDTLNLTVWRTDATADLKIKLVDYGSDDAWGNDNVEHEINLAAGTADAVAAGEWVSLEIDMSDFTGLTTSGNIGQIILSSHTYDGNGDPVNSGETLYIDNFFFSSTPAPTEPTAAPSAPTADSANVTSLFSDSYTDIASTTWSTSWDQTGDPEDVDLGGNTVKKYTNVGYIGIEPGSTIDASGMDTLNLTVWRTDATADLKIKLVDYGSDDAWGNDNVEHEINLAAGTADAVAAGEWVSLEIDMSDFTGLTTSGNIGQIILSSHTYDGNGDPVNSGETLYIDNFFFSSTPAPTEPTAAPSAPTADSANVTSLFSDSYTDIASTTWSTSWDQTGDPEDVDLGGNTVKKYTNVGYIGIEPGSTIDASGMDTLNLTVWRTDATADLKIKLVDYGSDDAWGNDNVEHEINLAAGTADAVAAGEWVSLEIDMSDFTGLTTSGNIGQIILSSHTYDGNGDPVNSGETLYIDNFFFSSTPPALEISFEPDDDSGYSLVSFGGNASEVVTSANAPTGSDGQVAKVTKAAGETWAGTTFIDLAGNGSELISDGSETVSIRILSAKDGATVRLKLEDSSNGNANVELDATTASDGVNEWETLTWDFSSADHNITFDKASIFFDFGNAGAGEEYYFDDVTFNGFIS